MYIFVRDIFKKFFAKKTSSLKPENSTIDDEGLMVPPWINIPSLLMTTNTYKSKIITALNENSTDSVLESIVFEMSKKSFNKQMIYDLFHQIYQEENDDKKIEPLLIILDRLVGYCPKDAILLPDEKINDT